MLSLANEEEDLSALGMSVKDADSTGSVDEDDEDEDEDEDDEDEDGEEEKEEGEKKEVIDPDEPLDGLAALERMEKELEKDEIDVGEEVEDEV